MEREGGGGGEGEGEGERGKGEGVRLLKADSWRRHMAYCLWNGEKGTPVYT